MRIVARDAGLAHLDRDRLANARFALDDTLAGETSEFRVRAERGKGRAILSELFVDQAKPSERAKVPWLAARPPPSGSTKGSPLPSPLRVPRGPLVGAETRRSRDAVNPLEPQSSAARRSRAWTDGSEDANTCMLCRVPSV